MKKTKNSSNQSLLEYPLCQLSYVPACANLYLKLFLTLSYCWLLQNSKDYVKRIEDDDDDDEDFGILGKPSVMLKVLVSLYCVFFLFFSVIPLLSSRLHADPSSRFLISSLIDRSSVADGMTLHACNARSL